MSEAPNPNPSPDAETDVGGPKRPALWQQLLPWVITALCFGYLYTRLSGAAARDGLGLIEYLGGIFGRVSWGKWLALMVPYSAFFFLIDSLVVWRVVSWFNTPVSYTGILPIRGSSYILSILNEQVGKGAMGLYLNRRYGVPGWEVGSSMIFIMFCEFFYLLGWATIGYSLTKADLPEVFGLIPWIAAAAAAFLIAWIAFFRSGVAPAPAKAAPGEEEEDQPVSFRDRPIFKSFREAGPLHYLTIVVFRSPALLAAVVVYTYALNLFGVEASMGQMLGYLPVIFFGAATPAPCARSPSRSG